MNLERKSQLVGCSTSLFNKSEKSEALSDQSHVEPQSPGWMKWMLICAGVYNLAFGIFAIGFPSLMFEMIGMTPPRYLELWQCIGMIVGVYGIGYIIAAYAPYRHWPIVLVGFLGKLFGPIGMAWAVFNGTLPLSFALANVTNDLIWLVPFGLVLTHAWRYHTNRT
ncbi:MAG: alkyl hydroperoxide reductase [Planctomycetota bacterium]